MKRHIILLATIAMSFVIVSESVTQSYTAGYKDESVRKPTAFVGFYTIPQCTLDTAGSSFTTAWIRAGYIAGDTTTNPKSGARPVPSDTNKHFSRYNPSIHTALVKLSTLTSDDTSAIDCLVFECALDTTGMVYINNDTSNAIIYDGASTDDKYPYWVNEDVIVTTSSASYGGIYPMQVYIPCWIRFKGYKSLTISETTFVDIIYIPTR